MLDDKIFDENNNESLLKKLDEIQFEINLIEK